MIRRLEPLSWLLVAVTGWSLACVVVALAGFGGRVAPLPDDRSLTPTLPPSPHFSTGSALKPLDAYGEAFNHPLFFPNRKPAVAHVPGKGGADAHPLDVVLTSVIMTPTLQMAIVQDPQTHKSLRVREGQPIGGDYAGWTLTGLSPRTADFDGGSLGRQTLSLRVFDGKGGPPPTRMGLTPQAVAGGILGDAARAAAATGDNGGGDAGNAPAAADPASPDQSDANAASNATDAAQAAQQQAEEIRRRIEQRRQQMQSGSPANDKE